MRVSLANRGQDGFTLLELLMATVVFLLVCGAIFGLLDLSEKNYGSETQISSSYQEARLAVDQIVRDFDEAGYPPASMYSAPAPDPKTYALSPVAWDPGYTGNPPNPCQVGTAGGGTCATPGDFDLIVETNQGGAVVNVNWIRYQLVGTTLFRAVVPKQAGVDPASATTAAGAMVPFIVDVVNNPPADQLAEFMAAYPSMYPGGLPVPIFQFTCDVPAAPTGTMPCPAAGTANSPTGIRDVDITLIVRTNQRDMQTQRYKLVELSGRGHRVNPDN
jgi:prepilin-type N-terminal cleavage/methylation domain-containing protein